MKGTCMLLRGPAFCFVACLVPMHRAAGSRIFHSSGCISSYGACSYRAVGTNSYPLSSSGQQPPEQQPSEQHPEQHVQQQHSTSPSPRHAQVLRLYSGSAPKTGSHQHHGHTRKLQPFSRNVMGPKPHSTPGKQHLQHHPASQKRPGAQQLFSASGFFGFCAAPALM